MTPRFVADENFNRDIIDGLRQRRPEVDIVRVQDVGLAGGTDPAVLEWAAKQGRVLVTHDIQTMSGHAYRRSAAGESMPGVMIIHENVPIRAAIDELELILLASSAEVGGSRNISSVVMECADMNEFNVIEKVRRALGRVSGEAVPAPPVIEEPVARLVHTDLGLPELFIKRAGENKMLVEGVYVGELAERLVGFLRERECRRIALAGSELLEKVGVVAAVREEGLEAKLWPEMTLDEVYEFDAGVTDVWCAVAETGSLVIRPKPEHGRALSLVPAVHVAVVEPKNFVADLVDLFEKIGSEGAGSGVSLITGPSKTADIEMNLVQGVHGPGVVKVFVLQ